MGIVLRGYKEMPIVYEDWLAHGSEFWVAVYWQHVINRKYMDMTHSGDFYSSGPCAILTYDHPVDPSIVLVLDAWIRFFEEWEPE